MKVKFKKPGLQKMQRLFYLFTALFLISSIIQANITGINLSVAVGFGLSALMFNFANQCETQRLRKQVESFIEFQEEINGINKPQEKETNNS